jgi:hypothetical protein
MRGGWRVQVDRWRLLHRRLQVVEACDAMMRWTGAWQDEGREAPRSEATAGSDGQTHRFEISGATKRSSKGRAESISLAEAYQSLADCVLPRPARAA